MYTTVFIIGLVSAGVSLLSSRVGRRKPTKRGKRITDILAVILFIAAITSVALGYWTNIKTESQASETIERVDRAEVQITEIRTPRRIVPESKRVLVERLNPYAGQKYDMKVFRDHDSLELASTIQAVLREAGWVYTNVYPKHGNRRYAETRDEGVFIVSSRAETKRTTEARTALHGALNEARLYDDSSAFIPMNCVATTEPIRVGTKITRIPCSESPIQSIKVIFTVHDDVIPEDTLALNIGKDRL